VDDAAAAVGSEPEPTADVGVEKPAIHCDRCGAQMIESRCKIVCLNCGSCLDCSDLSIYMD
jgi:hypothetical protein